MSIEFNPSKCCGCLACADVCPQNAISLKEDKRGFIYPQIDNSLCVECGLCEKTCAFSKNHNRNMHILNAAAFKLEDKRALLDSTSGGVFTALSNYVLKMDGFVAGAVMEDDFTVHHIITDKTSVRNRMRKSKYVQSNTCGIFNSVIKLLGDDKPVLFVGTPCQCAQMNRVVNKNSKDLIICDFLCHGVPNNNLLKEHISFLEKLFKKKATGYHFRGKEFGWHHVMEGIEFDGKMNYSKAVQSYSKFFYSGLSLRPSCLNCVYRGMNHCSDITIGDFWGIESINGLKDNEGVSLVVSNTEKGDFILKNILPEYGDLKYVSKEQVAHKFPSTPASVTSNENMFWNIYEQQGYNGLVSKYCDLSIKARLEWELKKYIKRIIVGIG